MFLFNVLYLLCLLAGCLCGSNDGFSLTIPIYLDIPKHLRFLIPKTQGLLDENLSQRDFEIEYKTKLIWGPGPSYTVKLDYGEEEAYFISPYGKTITIYQTDILIAFNKIHEFIARVIEDFLLKAEMDYFDSKVALPKDNIAIDIGPKHDVGIYVISPKEYNWDNALFQELFQPVINELQDLIFLNVGFEYWVDSVKPIIHLDDIETMLNHERLTFLIYLNDQDMKISGIDSKQIIIPKKGGVELVQVYDDLYEMEQIEMLETMTGQLFRLLGMNVQEPKSPFIRIDFLIRRQIYINYLKTTKEQQIKVDSLLVDAKWGDALRLTWDFLRSSG